MHIYFVLLLFVIAMCSAIEESREVFRHPLTDMPPPAEDVETVHHFPKYTEYKFPLGETVSVLCHFRNDGSSFYNISAIMGSLNSPVQFSHHYQNYSFKPFGTVVKSGEEITLKYSFTLHPDLEPSDYQLALTVFYDTSSEGFSSTFFNEVGISSIFFKIMDRSIITPI
jgi:translocon-associated protein subunit alpha